MKKNKRYDTFYSNFDFVKDPNQLIHYLYN